MERLLNEWKWYKNIARLLYHEEAVVATAMAVVAAALASVDGSIVVHFDGEAYQAFSVDVVEN